MNTNTSKRPLEGVRVLDLSRVLAGPWCTQILGDFGADVAKIEMVGVGDDTRRWGPPFLPEDSEGGPGESAYYLGCNRNKRSAAIDIADPAGADLIRRLAAQADILVENFRVGGLKKYQLDYESLRAINPKLVYCSITGFGQDGPYADRGGYDFIAQGMGGLMSITGDRDAAPTKVGVAITDLTTGIYANVSVLIALRHAEKTGIGQHIDCSLLDTQIAMLANQAMSWLVGATVPGRMGNAHPTVVPYRTFESLDGDLIIAVGNDHQFKALVKVLGRPDLALDERFMENSGRVIHRDALEAELEEIVGTWRSHQLIAQLVAAKVPAGPVNTIDQVFADTFIEARKSVHHFVRDDNVDIPTLAYPGKLSETPADYRREPPRLGQHTEEILSQWINLSTDELRHLAAAGVIWNRPGQQSPTS